MKEIFERFKMPIIIGGGFIVLFILLGKVMPIIAEMNSNKTPIVGIEASNDINYGKTQEILATDFAISAIHEDGGKTSIDPSQVEVSRSYVNPIGAKTVVTLTYLPDPTISCDVEVNVDRQKIVSFQCGYPNITNVVAVLYSNGELAFEGEGDVLTYEDQKYPWKQKYDNKDKNPITSISFGGGVQPTNFDGFFSGIETLVYIDKIPETVISMKGTFEDCTGLETMADWSDCHSLLNISECYKDCVSLKYTTEIPDHVVKATSAFEGCQSLQKTPSLTKAVSLVQADAMFKECSKLVSITMPPNVQVIDSMFKECINLHIMPTLPETILSMNSAFEGSTNLTTLTTIPESVKSMNKAFAKCDFITGECEINATPDDMNGCFDASCVTTKLNLTGKSLILDAFANSNKVGHITVNGEPAQTDIKSLNDYNKMLEKQQKELEKQQKEKEKLEAQNKVKT